MLQRRTEKAWPLHPFRKECPEEGRLVFTGVLQSGTDRNDRNYGRHHYKSKVQGPAYPTQELLCPTIQRFHEIIHGVLPRDSIARDSVPPVRLLRIPGQVEQHSGLKGEHGFRFEAEHFSVDPGMLFGLFPESFPQVAALDIKRGSRPSR